jgi:hypothetical protein
VWTEYWLVNYENYHLLVYSHIILHQPTRLCLLPYTRGSVMLWTLKYMCQNNSYVSCILPTFTLLLKMWGIDRVPPELNKAVSENLLRSSTNLFTLKLTKNSHSGIRNFFSCLFLRVWQRCKVVTLISKILQYSSFMINSICKQNYWALAVRI